MATMLLRRLVKVNETLERSSEEKVSKEHDSEKHKTDVVSKIVGGKKGMQ